MEISRKLASHLLQSKAIIIDPANPFQWASGWHSPMYCDNRRTLSYPAIRRFIRDAFIQKIKDHFGKPDMIAGVATGAIGHAALVAEKMGLPFIYVRTSRKPHGTGNLIEGDPSQGESVVVIEDLISTGGSSLRAVAALREKGLNLLGMGAIFTYEFPEAIENFKNAGVPLFTLCNYHTLIEEALQNGSITDESIDVLSEWRSNPAKWNPGS